MSGHPWYKQRRWQRRSRAQLTEHPLCRMCLEERGEVVAAEVADHVEPHRFHYHKFWFGELQSLCKPCHDGRKQMLEKRGYLPDIGLDGWPTDRRHPANQQK